MKTFFAGIVAAIATLFGGTSQAPLPPDSMPAASAVAITTHTVTPGFAASDPANATTTVVNNYVTSPVVERIVETRALDMSVLDERILALKNDMLLRIAQVASPAINFSGPAASTPVSVASFATSQNIDSLTNVTLTNATVSGVAGLTDADVPDSITASNYLPLTGGSLTFASSTLFSVFDNAYFGGTATSSFDSAGALTLATALLVSSGGTGANTFGQGWIYSGGGTGSLAASTSPSVNYLVATSTSFASHFPYASTTAISVTGTAHFPGGGIWNSSGNVGIGTTTPFAKLSIQGTLGGNDLLNIASSTGSGILYVNNAGQVGVGTANLGVVSQGRFNTLVVRQDVVDTNTVANSNNTVSYPLAVARTGQNGAAMSIGSDNNANGILAVENRDMYIGYNFNSTFAPVITVAGKRLGGTGTVGNVGIGTTSPFAALSISNPYVPGCCSNQPGAVPLFVIASSTPVSTSTLMIVTNAGNVGIGLIAPTAQLHTTGTVRFQNFGAGTLTTDANGNVSASSDERLKDIQGEFTAGLTQIEKLDPILYKWKSETGFDVTTTYAGFFAQNVQAAIPEAVGEDKDGFLTLQDRPLIAAVVNAIKEIAKTVTSFADRFATKELTFTRASGDEIDVQKLCIGSVCITETQLQAMLAAAGEAGTAPQTSSAEATSPAPTEPPVIIIAGENPARIHIGDTYNDLGAIAKDAAGHDLSVKLLLNGALVSDIVLDTSAAATDTIDYVATDGSGNTATSTRTIIIETADAPPTVPSDSPSIDATTTQATSTVP